MAEDGRNPPGARGRWVGPIRSELPPVPLRRSSTRGSGRGCRALHGFQNPCDGMRNARLKREDASSHAMIIVSSAIVSSSQCRCIRANSSSSTSRRVSVIASALFERHLLRVGEERALHVVGEERLELLRRDTVPAAHGSIDVLSELAAVPRGDATVEQRPERHGHALRLLLEGGPHLLRGAEVRRVARVEEIGIAVRARPSRSADIIVARAGSPSSAAVSAMMGPEIISAV